MMLTVSETLELAAGESNVRITLTRGGRIVSTSGSITLCNFRPVNGVWAYQGPFDTVTLTTKSGRSVRLLIADMVAVELI